VRYAPNGRNLDESIEELRQIAGGRNDIFAEAAGMHRRPTKMIQFAERQLLNDQISTRPAAVDEAPSARGGVRGSTPRGLLDPR
jgi:hypothetical protein